MEEQKTQISSELEALCAPLPAAAERAPISPIADISSICR